ncbi:MAG: 2-phosphosulfolactate phosphatase [Calditrichaeota bacterium]|nr:2-phosphosulfolactate phosphatase [Calditrichota bacterium]MBT7617267.1 2-phosphosulfolactate phosphatase [Calditrichota bacterium]MBT7787410.1 2-phosphosulfolactate phosphatase [Calditrichota bacterium]
MDRQSEDTKENQIKRKVDLFFTPAAVAGERLKGYNAVVIDVLRAATSITTALNNGAKGVIPSESSSAVIDLANEMGKGDLLLCGEKDGRMVEGFHLGNSPSDYSKDRVRGKILVFGSTNGTPAVVRASIAKSVWLCGFINLDAIVDAIFNSPDPFPLAILCAGKYNGFALEDVACGGLLVERIISRFSSEELHLNDAARSAMLIYKEFCTDTLTLLRNCEHGKFLIDIGMESDLPICASDSLIPIAPCLNEGRFINPDG